MAIDTDNERLKRLLRETARGNGRSFRGLTPEAMQILIDRPMIEVCGNDGVVFITSGRGQKGKVAQIKAFAEGDGAELLSLEAYELKSIWNKE